MIIPIIIIGVIILASATKATAKPITNKRKIMYANYKKTAPLNNNPGNIIWKNPKTYQGGLSNLQNGTVVFDTLQNGTRAMLTTLLWYYNTLLKPQNFSIKGIVSKWAPNDDKTNKFLRGNDEGIYTKTVSDLSGLGATQVLEWNKENLYKVIRAMCVQEHGLDAVTETIFNQAWESLKK